MCAAVEALRRSGGGFVVVEDGRVVAEVPLPLAGLMSFRSCEELSVLIERFNEAARERGVRPEVSPPIIAMTGLALAVIPAVRITDRHPLFDVESQDPLPPLQKGRGLSARVPAGAGRKGC